MLAGLAVLLSNAAAFAADAEVKIANFTFDPPTLTVPVAPPSLGPMATTSPM